MFSALADDKKSKEQEYRLCPDIDSLGDLLKVEGTYSNYHSRTSFNIQAVLCEKSKDPSCADPGDID